LWMNIVPVSKHAASECNRRNDSHISGYFQR
jgi:hypothetical protein